MIFDQFVIEIAPHYEWRLLRLVHAECSLLVGEYRPPVNLLDLITDAQGHACPRD